MTPPPSPWNMASRAVCVLELIAPVRLGGAHPPPRLGVKGSWAPKSPFFLAQRVAFTPVLPKPVQTSAKQRRRWVTRIGDHNSLGERKREKDRVPMPYVLSEECSVASGETRG